MLTRGNIDHCHRRRRRRRGRRDGSTNNNNNNGNNDDDNDNRDSNGYSDNVARSLPPRQQPPPPPPPLPIIMSNVVVRAPMPIKYLVSVDGFYVCNVFHPKELSILDLGNWGDCSIFTERYRLDTELELDKAARKHVNFLRRFVHGMSFANASTDKPSGDLPETLRRVISDVVATNALIAHKGGIHTRNMLRGLGAANNLINLEDLGCPKFEKIYACCSRYMNLYKPCPNHRWIVNPRMCTRMKLIAYRVWLVSAFAKNLTSDASIYRGMFAKT